MFFIFSKKKRQEIDDKRAKEVEQIKASSIKELDKVTKEVEKVNTYAAKVDVTDLAERIYFATRRHK